MADAPDVADVGYQGDNGTQTGQMAAPTTSQIAAEKAQGESAANAHKSADTLRVPGR